MNQDWKGRLARVERLAGSQGADREKVLGELVDALQQQSGDLDALNTAVDALSQMGASVVPALLPLLRREQTAETRIAGTLVLGQLGSETAVPALLGLLDDSDPNVIYHAVEALGRLKARRAALPLAQLTRSGDPFLAFPALFALSQIEDPAALPDLLLCLDDDLLHDEAVTALSRSRHLLAVLELARLWQSEALPVEVLLEAWGRLLAIPEQAPWEAVDRWLAGLPADRRERLLNCSPEAAQWAAYGACHLLARLAGRESASEPHLARTLREILHLLPSQLGQPPLFPFEGIRFETLAGILRESDVAARLNLVALLATGAGENSASLLPLLMRDEHAEVRLAAAEAFAADPGELSLEDLVAFASSPDPEFRSTLLRAGHRIGAMSAERWREWLTHPDPACRALAAHAAAYWPSTRDDEPEEEGPGSLIERWLEEPDETVRLALLQSAVQREEPLEEWLLERWQALGSAETAAVTGELFRFSEGVALQLLTRALSARDLWTRLQAARFCQSQPQVARQLPTEIKQRLFQEPLPPLRAAAVLALSEEQADWPDRLRCALADPEAEVVRACWLWLGLGSSQPASDWLRSLYLEADRSERQELLDALVGGPAARALAEWLVEQDDPDDRVLRLLWSDAEHDSTAHALASQALEHLRPDWLDPQDADRGKVFKVARAMRALPWTDDPASQSAWADSARRLQDFEIETPPGPLHPWATRAWLLALFSLRHPATEAAAKALLEHPDSALSGLAGRVLRHWPPSPR